MQQTFTNFKEFVKGLQILHLALAVGVFLVLFILKYILGVDKTANESLLFSYMAIGIAGMSFLLGTFIYNKRIDEIKSNKSRPAIEKIAEYRAAFIFRLATLEGPAMIAIILHFLEGHPITFYVAVAMIALLIVQRPTADKIKSEIGLSTQEIGALT